MTGGSVFLDGKRVLVTGGTGSLGQRVVERLLRGDAGNVKSVIVMSRDETKQHAMRLRFLGHASATDDVIYARTREGLQFRIGDVRDLSAMIECVRDADVIIHAAALKQVPTCEFFTREAVLTNTLGADVVVRALHMVGHHVEAVVGISTDKACKPVNVMGLTKALMERLLIAANLSLPSTRFVCVRYGNVIGSRGSVIPLFEDQIARGGPITITTPDMTRFLVTLDQAVEAVFAVLAHGRRGEIFVPRAGAARVMDIATAMRGDRPMDIRFIGVRPGEKTHEVLVSEEELGRTSERDGYYVIAPMLPGLEHTPPPPPCLSVEYSSAHAALNGAALAELIESSRRTREAS
jgi:FlaA1/EpsC-like NDP-sugar epimerase